MSHGACPVFGSGNQECGSRAPTLRSPVFILLLATLPVLLASCNYPGILWVPPVYYTIGGSVSGLTGTGLVLQDNNGNNLTVGAGATSFTFTVGIAGGGNYDVTVFSQPSGPSQTCRVTNGSGPVTNANITRIQVTCTTDSFTIGGMISGLAGTGLVLQDNGGNNLSVSAGATSFTFTAPIASGGSYDARVFSQPSNPSQTCLVTNGTGPVTNANITTVQISCTTDSFTIGGTISGLTGAGLVLQDNGANNLLVGAGATSFTFTAAIPSGGSYNVKVFSQPSNPSQTCAVANGNGLVTNANITSVQVNCTTDSFTIGGTLSGLTGAGLVLLDNGGNNLTISAGATTFTFTASIPSGGSYNVTVFSQPSNPSQTCGVTNGTGPVTNANITSVQVTCTANVGSLTGIFAYVANQTSENLDAYAVLTDGALQLVPGAPFSTGGNSTAGAADPSGKFLYIANTVPSNVAGYLIAMDGSVQLLPSSPYPTGSGPVAVTIDPTGRFAYTPNCGRLCSGTGNGNVSAFAIDVVTGALTPITGSPFTAGQLPYDIAIPSSGKFAYVANYVSGNVSVFAIQQTTGALAEIAGSPFAAGEFPISVAINPQNNILFVANTGSSNVSAYTINADGSLSPVPGSPFNTGIYTASVTVDFTGRFAYAAAGAGVFGFAIGSGGNLVPLPGSPFAAGTGPNWIRIDPTNHFVYVANAGDGTISGFALNQSTGALTAVPGSPFRAGTRPTSVVLVSVPQ